MHRCTRKVTDANRCLTRYIKCRHIWIIENVFDETQFGSFDYREAIRTDFTEAHCQFFASANASVALCSYGPGLAIRMLSVRPSFCPTVRPFVKRVICNKTKEICAYLLAQHERTFILVF